MTVRKFVFVFFDREPRAAKSGATIACRFFNLGKEQIRYEIETVPDAESPSVAA